MTVGCPTTALPGGQMCCRAQTADCLACSAGVPEEKYCQDKPKTTGCLATAPALPGGQMCCEAMTADCLACSAGVSVEKYCQDKPKTAGCPEPVPVSRLAPRSPGGQM